MPAAILQQAFLYVVRSLLQTLDVEEKDKGSHECHADVSAGDLPFRGLCKPPITGLVTQSPAEQLVSKENGYSVQNG